MREIFEDQQEITTLTVIWARQLVNHQPKLEPVPCSREEPAPTKFDAVERPCGETSELAKGEVPEADYSAT